jgi:hypothetical protein
MVDDIVRQAMVKWPHVPDCFGWLGLDSRGQWYMRDDRTQALGAFASGLPGTRGSALRHEKLIEFIERNYECDPMGQWYFQNGPQRVFVELDATPWIWRIGHDLSVSTHSGISATPQQVLLDEAGRLYLSTSIGLGLVHSQDMLQAAQALENGNWPAYEDVRSSTLPERYAYVPSPQSQQEAARKKAGH